MDPVTMGALISASAGLLGNLFKTQTERELQKQKMQVDTSLKGLDTQAQAQHNYGTGQQNMFSNLMSQYSNILR